MTTKRSRMVFINLAVRDLKRSMEFFSKLGFEFNMQFTDETAACMVISESAFVMLVTEKRFKDFTKKQICDTSTHTEGLFALSTNGRAEVDEMVEKAIAGGGAAASEPIDHGFMYYRAFYDLDGHHWELVYMEPSAVQQQ